MSRLLKAHERLAAIVAAVIVIAALGYGGAQPYAVGLVPPPWDKLAHAALFAVISAMIGLASGARGWRMVIIALAGAMLVAVGDEWHQASLPGRNASAADLCADLAGALVGALLPLRRRRSVRKR